MLGEVVYRAELLGVLSDLYQGAHLSLDDALAFMDAEDFYKMADATEDDRHLINSCLELEAEIAERNWRKLERVLSSGALTPRYGPDDMLQLDGLPVQERWRAVLDLIEIGWLPPDILLPNDE